MSIIDEIAIHLQVGRKDVAKFLYAAPARYKVFSIAKRNGGMRTIAQPSAALKTIQRFLVDSRLRYFPVHEAAAAYVVGKGISDNANLHRKSRYVLKLDFHSFFNSLRPVDWRRVLENFDKEPIHRDDLYFYEKILFWGDGTFTPKMLSVGAPSSPILSNIIMYRFDEYMANASSKTGSIYTRYADDITISANSREICSAMEREAAVALKKLKYPSLKFNAEKRGLYGRGERRMVTGLVITPTSAISIGRERKRLISAMVHRASLGQLDAGQMNELKGLLGFAHAAEPQFLDSLRRKYGDELLTKIAKYQRPG